MKIPKQFWHWCELNYIKPIQNKRKNKYFFKGLGERYFRITIENNGQFLPPNEFQAIIIRTENNVRKMTVTHRFSIPQTYYEFHCFLDEVFRSDFNERS